MSPEQKVIEQAPIEAAVGGFHLCAATDEELEWTTARLREVGLRHFLVGRRERATGSR